MNPIDFNRKMAELKGFRPFGTHGIMCYDENEDVMPTPDYYNDLNLLMPLAWKFSVTSESDPEDDPEWSAYKTKSRDSYGPYILGFSQNKDPKEAIRQCLIKIYEETNT